MAQNFLSPKSFKFKLARAPSLEYYVQAVNLPAVSTAFATIPTPFSDQRFAPDKMEFTDLSLTFRVDENMANYVEMFNWMKGITGPSSFVETAALRNRTQGDTSGVYSDATLLILNSTGNPEIEVKFEDVFPTALTDIQFDIRAADVEYAECSASFTYKSFALSTV